MNKQELIEKIKKLPFVLLSERYISQNYVLELLEQLDEPQKVVVPQFVADWIEECKNDDFHLFGAMEAISLNQKKLDYWFREDDNMELFARAWLDGYEEVEEEKRYVVSLKNGQPLTKTKSGKAIYFNQDIIIGNYKFTRKELEEANFGWVFNCPGIEIKEVTE